MTPRGEYTWINIAQGIEWIVDWRYHAIIIKCVMRYSSESNFTRSAREIDPKHAFDVYIFKITTTYPRGQWVNTTL